MALHFRGITPSPLQLMGDNGGLRAIVDEQPCAGTAYVVARAEHVPVVESLRLGQQGPDAAHGNA